MKNVSVPLLVILAIHAVAGVEENSVRGLSNQSFFGSFDSKKAASGPGDRGKRRPGRGPIRKGKGGSDKGDDDDNGDGGSGSNGGHGGKGGYGGDSDDGGGSDGGNGCGNNRVTQTWSDVKLTPQNSIPFFSGVGFSYGTANVELVVSQTCFRGEFFEACISSSILGFVPRTLHISRGRVHQNGPTVADFSNQLGENDYDFDGCTPISEDLYLELIRNPEEFHVNAIAGGTAGNRGIRGQLVQSFMAILENQQTVAPYDTVIPGASGRSTMTVEAAGQVICFDATINGFDPELARLYFGEAGSNGNIVFDFSAAKVGAGRFLGCLPIETLGIGVQTVNEILADSYLYYMEFRVSASKSSPTIRGQLPRPTPGVIAS